MSNRNFDNRVIIQRLQNQNYARNLYQNNTNGRTLINNPQNTDGTSSRYTTYVPGAQTEYFRGLLGAGETVSIGGIVNIPPFPSPTVPAPAPPSVPGAPTITKITGTNGGLTINFTAPLSDGGSSITDYDYSTDNGTNWTSSGTISSPILISGLSNGAIYQVQIRAVNSVGDGSPSLDVPGVPNETVVSFTSPLDTLINWTAPEGVYSVEYLVVGGGGGGGNGYDTGGGGGGGGGMVRTGTLSIIPSNIYSIQVGSGGNGGGNDRRNIDASNGNISQFDTIIALGGGFGKGSRTQTGGSGLGGAGAIIPSTATVGGNGGGSVGTSVGGSGGGGGGAGGNGTSGTGSVNVPISGGTGGAGITSSISGSSFTYGMGGNGAKGNTNVAGTIGTANTGNGGSAGSNISGNSNAGGNGGSGIVILRY